MTDAAVRGQIQKEANVSRETMERLDVFVDRLITWNTRINLIGRSTAADVWRRHVLDSAQLAGLAPPQAGHWVDLGAGGGLPGLVIAAINAEKEPKQTVTLVESDRRKAAFLMTAAQAMDVQITVLSQRIEDTDPLNADILSARALAPLSVLLEMAARHLAHGGLTLFPKGARAQDEIASCKLPATAVIDRIPSRTSPEAEILRISGLKT